MIELCLGVCCPIHAQCTRYLDIEGAINATFMGTCLEDGKRPLFIRVNTQQNSLQSEKSALQLRHQQTE